ncbi:hypothetical protein HLB23_07800 [Nocardia uniformis]|uniref:Uncharacterized protein n=1 Tax=Nocardia uniformis TaxID=53432 RepID=A0A849BZU5_9NOCA|nr:hypothetical protein [Nocardia uniformis]NNH69770.1 hypothetical protein [Nocardia uniformis]
MASAADLPSAQGAALVDAARGAFTTGLGTVAVVCAVTAAALAIAVLRSLRTVAIDAAASTDRVPSTHNGVAGFPATPRACQRYSFGE